jgi:hypothetical protein
MHVKGRVAWRARRGHAECRAERKCGELLVEMAEHGERAKPGGDGRNQYGAGSSHDATTLEDLGPRQARDFTLPAERPCAPRHYCKAERSTWSCAYLTAPLTGERDPQMMRRVAPRAASRRPVRGGACRFVRTSGTRSRATMTTCEVAQMPASTGRARL